MTTTTRSTLTTAAVALVAACSSSTMPATSTFIDCQLTQSTGQAIAPSVQTTLSFDRSSCPDVPPGDRIVLPAGRWLVQAQLTWSPNAAGQRGMVLRVNGSTMPAQAGAPAMGDNHVTIQSVSAVVESDGSAYVEATGSQTSGVAIQTWVNAAGNAPPTYLHATRLN